MKELILIQSKGKSKLRINRFYYHYTCTVETNISVPNFDMYTTIVLFWRLGIRHLPTGGAMNASTSTQKASAKVSRRPVPDHHFSPQLLALRNPDHLPSRASCPLYFRLPLNGFSNAAAWSSRTRVH